MHAKTMPVQLTRAIPVLLMVLAAPALAQEEGPSVPLRQLLQSEPMSLEPHGSLYEGYQFIIDVPRNLETLYGVGCVLEVPYIGKNRPERFPSKEADYVPLEVAETTTLHEFLDHTCSDGKLTWGIVRNALHIWPTTMRPSEEDYLDTVRVSLDLQGVSLLEAGKAWALAVNKNRTFPGHGVWSKHPFVLADPLRSRATPDSLTREGAVTLRLDNVTAREALCAIQGASREWVRVTYHHHSSFRNSANLFPSQSSIKATPKISPEEREALNAAEALDSVLVAPATEGGEIGE